MSPSSPLLPSHMLAGAQQAAAREHAALLRRLQHALPDLLADNPAAKLFALSVASPAGNTAAAGSATGAAGGSGALPGGKAKSGAAGGSGGGGKPRDAGLPAEAVAEAFCRDFDDLCARLPAAALAQPAAALAGFRRFVRHWLAAARGAAQPLLDGLAGRLKTGGAAARQGAALALAALCSSGTLPESQVAEVITQLEGILKGCGEGAAPSLAAAAAAAGLAAACGALHRGDWPTRGRVAATLAAQLQRAPSSPVGVQVGVTCV